MLRSSVLLPEILRQKTDAALPTADSSQPVAAEVDGGHHPAGFPRRIIGKLMPKYLWSYTYYTERWKRTRKRGRMKMRKPLRNPPIPAPVPDSHLEANPPRPSFIYPKKLSGGDEACTIRLLNLHPGRPEDLICCDLQCVSLSETPEYEAISYCWGTQAGAIEIRCDGRPFMITKELAAAFTKFRREDSNRLLWVDAICINQDDTDEKNCQVPLMRTIYEKAMAVQVWLGKDTPEGLGEKAFNLLEALKNAWMSLGWKFHFSHLAANTSRLNPSSLPSVDHPDWPVVGKLIEMPWFGRAWIIQEIVVSRTAILHCGPASLSWNDFYVAFLFGLSTGFFTIRSDVICDFLAYQHLSQLIITYHCMTDGEATALDFATLLENHRTAGATDPRDKAYALLGLSELIEDRKHGIIPDYNLQAAEVYEKIAKTVLEKSSTLDLLGVSKVVSRQPVGRLPSWAPDWSVWDFASSLCFRNVQGKYVFDFDATTTSSIPKHLVIKEHTLELSGHTFDRICKVGRPLDPFPEPEDFDQFRIRIFPLVTLSIAMLNDWSFVARSLSGRKYPTGERIMDAFIKTLFLGDVPGFYPMESERGFLEEHITRVLEAIGAKLQGPRLQQFLDWRYSRALRWRITDPAGLGMIVTAFYKPSIRMWGVLPNMLGRTIHRKMIRTTQGYIGLAPRLTEEGDYVALVKGGRVPLVLRPRGGQWELIGGCYLHGIMHGEGFEESKCQDIKIV
jgi:hypothetical protein